MSVDELDCEKCGACCTDQLVMLLTKKDDGVPLHVRDGNRMGNCNDRCVALMGRVGVSVSCSIYKDRPDMCRAFEKGSKLCLEIRRHKGLP